MEHFAVGFGNPILWSFCEGFLDIFDNVQMSAFLSCEVNVFFAPLLKGKKNIWADVDFSED